MTKKTIATLIIIAIGIILLIVGGPSKKNQEILPTRDVEGIEGYCKYRGVLYRTHRFSRI
jgi:hypothetical protein